MKPYIYSKSKESSVECNCDLVIGKLFDGYSSKIMLVSLVDYPMIVKKVCSDRFISYSDVYLKDKSNKRYKQKIYTLIIISLLSQTLVGIIDIVL